MTRRPPCDASPVIPSVQVSGYPPIALLVAERLEPSFPERSLTLNQMSTQSIDFKVSAQKESNESDLLILGKVSKDLGHLLLSSDLK